MADVNGPQDHIYEWAEPHSGRAELHWTPMTKMQRRIKWMNPIPQVRPAPKLAIKISTTCWDYAEKPPFSWLVIEQPEINLEPPAPGSIASLVRGGQYALERADLINEPTKNVMLTLIIFAAPHVTLTFTDRQKLKEQGLTIKVVRLASWQSVPEPGSVIDPAKYFSAIPLTDYFDTAKQWHLFLEQYIVFESGVETLIVAPDKIYQIRVTQSEHKPSFFNIGMVVRKSREGIHHDYYIGTTADVKIEAWRGVTHIRQPLNPEIKVAVFQYRITPKAPKESSRFLGTLIGCSSALPFIPCQAGTQQIIGWAPDFTPPLPKRGPVTHCDGLEDPPIYVGRVTNADEFTMTENVIVAGYEARTFAPMIIDTAIGIIPVIGTIYDVATLCKIGITGTDFWGENKSEIEIALIGGFLLLGSFGRIIKGTRQGLRTISRLGNTAAAFFPNWKIVSLNPGLSALFLRFTNSVSDPVLIKAAENVLTTRATVEYAEKLESTARLFYEGTINSDEAFKVMKELFQAISDETDKILKITVKNIDTHPAFLAATSRINPAKVIAHQDLGVEAYSRVMKILEDVKKSGDPSNLIPELRKIADEAANTRKAADLSAGIVTDPDLLARIRNFPEVWIDHTAHVMRRDVGQDKLVVKRYREYLANGGKITNIEEYAIRYSRGPLRAYLMRRYGQGGIDFMLGRSRTSRETIAEILDKPGAMAEVRRLLHKVDTYENLREEIISLAGDFPGLGRILEADHLIEKRIRIISEETILAPEHYTSMLVPANQAVSEALRSRGLDGFLYIHRAKTARMNQLIPQGREISMSLESITDAYQRFWVHELKMPFEKFVDLFEDSFQQLAKDAGKDAPSLIYKPRDILDKSITSRWIDMGSERLYFQKLKNKATTSSAVP